MKTKKDKKNKCRVPLWGVVSIYFRPTETKERELERARERASRVGFGERKKKTFLFGRFILLESRAPAGYYILNEADARRLLSCQKYTLVTVSNHADRTTKEGVDLAPFILFFPSLSLYVPLSGPVGDSITIINAPYKVERLPREEKSLLLSLSLSLSFARPSV